MHEEPPRGPEESASESVMAAMDPADGLVIADTARDDAWVAMESGGAPLAEWA